MDSRDAIRFYELARRQQRIHARQMHPEDNFDDLLQDALVNGIQKGLHFEDDRNAAGLVYRAIHLEIRNRRAYRNRRKKFDGGSIEEFEFIFEIPVEPLEPEPHFWNRLESLVPKIQAGSLRSFRAWVQAGGNPDGALAILDADPTRPILGRAVAAQNPDPRNRRNALQKAIKKITPYALQILEAA